MSLQNILLEIEGELGSVIPNTAEYALRLQKLNKAAREIHIGNDIPEAMDEKVFDINVDSQQISLPGYVDRVRGWRFYDSRRAIDVDTPDNRWNYFNCGENEVWYNKWRKKRQTALTRELSNQSTITFTIPAVETSDIVITLTGRTDKTWKFTETVTIVAGSLSVETMGNWIEVESIVKNRITTYDILVSDVEDNEVGRLLNSEFQTYYNVYQIADTEGFQLPAETSSAEIYFKYKLQPFAIATDTFHGTDKYDQVIFWKFMEHESRKTEDAVMFAGKCKATLNQLLEDESAGQRRKIKFTQNTFFNLPYNKRVWPYA